VTVTPQAKERLWSALGFLASAPVAERTLTGLSVLLQSGALKQALALVGRPTSALSTLAFGLRMWASVCLALYVAFWLELDNPFWAGTTSDRTV
jgi:hypothetical protein